MNFLESDEVNDELSWIKNLYAGEFYEPTKTQYLNARSGNAEAIVLLEKYSRIYMPAKYLLARVLFERSSVISLGQTRKLFEEAAEQNFAPAICWLAYMCEIGLTEAGIDKVIAQYERAASLGYLPAINHLAHGFYGGQFGVNRRAEAIKWLEIAAEANCSGADSVLGAAYLLGEVVPLNITKAKRWLTHAATRGDELAAMVLKTDDRLH